MDVGTDVPAIPGKFYCPLCAVITIRGNHHGPASRMFHGNFRNFSDFPVGQAKEMAVSGGQNDRPAAMGDARIYVATQPTIIDAPITVKRRVNRSYGPTQVMVNLVSIHGGILFAGNAD
jgi:hypothetical protein